MIWLVRLHLHAHAHAICTRVHMWFSMEQSFVVILKLCANILAMASPFDVKWVLVCVIIVCNCIANSSCYMHRTTGAHVHVSVLYVCPNIVNTCSGVHPSMGYVAASTHSHGNHIVLLLFCTSMFNNIIIHVTINSQKVRVCGRIHPGYMWYVYALPRIVID